MFFYDRIAFNYYELGIRTDNMKVKDSVYRALVSHGFSRAWVWQEIYG